MDRNINAAEHGVGRKNRMFAKIAAICLASVMLLAGGTAYAAYSAAASAEGSVRIAAFDVAIVDNDGGSSIEDAPAWNATLEQGSSATKNFTITNYGETTITCVIEVSPADPSQEMPSSVLSEDTFTLEPGANDAFSITLEPKALFPGQASYEQNMDLTFTVKQVD